MYACMYCGYVPVACWRQYEEGGWKHVCMYVCMYVCVGPGGVVVCALGS